MNKRSLIAATLAVFAAGCQKSDRMVESNAMSDTNGAMHPANPDSLSITQEMQAAKAEVTNDWQKVKDMSTNAWGKSKELVASAAQRMNEEFGQTNLDQSYGNKDAFIIQAQGSLAELDQKINEVSDRTANASDAVKADAQARLQPLRDKRADLDKKLDEVKSATVANWEQSKDAFRKAYHDLNESIQQTKLWMADHISQ